jgi:hypothetical protein
MDEEKKSQIANALVKKGVNQPCPRCAAKNFEVVGQTFLPINDNPNLFVVGGPMIPSAIVACSNCGFLTLHALQPLKLLPQADQKTGDE